MAAPYNDLLSKLEEAAKAVIDGLALAGVKVNTGLEDEKLALPYVVCSAVSSTEEIIDTGLHRVKLRIVVASDADAHQLAAHRERVAPVFAELRQDDIEATLSAKVEDFDVTFVREEGQSVEHEGRRLKNVLELDAVCCGLDLT